MIIPISLSGTVGVGKSALGEKLVEFLNRHSAARKFSWAAAVKRIATEQFGWDGVKDERGRRLLQVIGTEAGREYNPDIWIDKLMEDMLHHECLFQIDHDPDNVMWRCEQCGKEGAIVAEVKCCEIPKPLHTVPPFFAVIDDTRFRNEFDAVASRDGVRILIERPDNPGALTGSAAQHASEQSIPPRSAFDAVLINQHETLEQFLDYGIQSIRSLLIDKKGLQV